MTDDLLRRYGGPVPRYTSYPTAPHFQAGVGADAYRDWLGRLGGDDRLSLYIHVPFCAAMCWYCGCHTKVVRQYRPIAAYVGLLHAELALVSGAIGARPGLSHVHFGGGTPNLLSPDDFRALMEALRARFDFDERAEVAVEIDPRTLREEMVAAMADSGVTRASLGVQDFAPEVQAAINRVQPFEMTARAVDRLRAAGIAAINFDLMYGLPGQTRGSVVDTVERAIRLGPDRLALFGYAHVPWLKTHQKMIDEAALPGPAERFAQAEAAGRHLALRGYRAIGLDHFARESDAMTRALNDGRLRRNFQGYTTDAASALIGLGASAIGALPDGYVQNAVPFKSYATAIEGGALAVNRGLRLSDDDRARRLVIERLMCQMEADIGSIERQHRLPAWSLTGAIEALRPMAADGLVELSGDHVRITERGRPFMRSACAAFDRYLGQGAARHSRAV